MTTWQMYWLVSLDNIRHGIWILGICAALAAIICFIASLAIIDGSWTQRDERRARRLLWWMTGFIGVTIFWCVSVSFVPTTKQAAAIVIVPAVCDVVKNDEHMKAIPGEIAELASDWLKELKPKAQADKEPGHREVR